MSTWCICRLNNADGVLKSNQGQEKDVAVALERMPARGVLRMAEMTRETETRHDS